MDRVTRRWFAALRLLLVAVSVCLFGATSFAERHDPRLAAGSPQAHAESIDIPAPGPALFEESDAEPRGAEDDDLAHAPRPGLTFIASTTARVITIRGPPPPQSHPQWQPRSSRGPPAQIERTRISPVL